MLKVPVSALFRCGSGWCVFVVEGNRATRRESRPGHMSVTEAEVLSGLREGEEVVRHPSNELEEGGRVRTHPQAQRGTWMIAPHP